MRLWDIINQTPYGEIDYVSLKSILAKYRSPRNKITALLASGVLIRVKKGLYVFSDKYAKFPYSKEILANLIYGPSAISLDYALASYQLIPERVNSVTSICNKKNKHFNTPVGLFTYRYIHPSKYDVGLIQKKLPDGRFVLFASQEKALADKILLTKPALKIRKLVDLKDYLFADFRIDKEKLMRFNHKLLKEIMLCYQHPVINLLVEYINNE